MITHRWRQLFATVLALSSLAISSTGVAEPAPPSLDLLRQELQHDLPVMWRVADFAVEDAFSREADGGSVWKARFRAAIETTEATYVPTEPGVGAITVVRPAYHAGVKRKIHGRLTAGWAESGEWEFRFTFDNRPTMTAGLPLDYFVGRIVLEGSDEHLELVENTQQLELRRAVDRHRAALATARVQHDEQLRAIEASLAEADRLEAARADLAERVATLREAVDGLGSAVDRLATEVASEGIQLSQWVASAADSTIRSRRGSSAAELVGAPDVEECNRKSRTQKAWFVGAHEKGEQSVTVHFLEPVVPTAVVVYEQSSTGFVKMLQLHGELPGQSTVETVIDVQEGCSGDAHFPVAGITFPVRAVTITVDGDRPGNKAIDAVQLLGVKRFEE